MHISQLHLIKYLFVGFIVTLISCKVSRTDIVGTYQTKEAGQVRYWLDVLNNQSRSTGSQLVVREDSTFTYTSCANLIEGTWSFDSDSLFLYSTSNVFIDSTLRDSMERIGKSLAAEMFVYEFERGKFVSRSTIKNGMSELTLVEVLEK